MAFIIYKVNTIINHKSEALQSSLAQITTNAQQAYSGIRVIKSFVQEASVYKNFEEGSEEYRKQAVALAKVEALYFPSMTLLIGISTLLTIMIGGLYYITGQREIGIDVIVEFVIYINLLTFPVSAIGWTASMMQRAAASQKRLNEFLETKPSIVNDRSSMAPKLSGEIVLKDVQFTYAHTGIEAIKNFNLKIAVGETVAVVGRTGSGKTTLAQLLMRMFDANAGSIKLDGVDIKNIDLLALRSQVSYVPQDGFLFSDTVANNIAFGATTNNEEGVKQAAALAVVSKDIEGFDKGYQTEIGERGVTLSGGQKQRISIARALLKQAPIFILDDCLSAVDARTENEIIANLKIALKGKTCLLITHRIFNLLHFDRIIVMEDGTIAEEGSHTVLMQKKGLYHQMYLRQLQEEQMDDGEANLAVTET